MLTVEPKKWDLNAWDLRQVGAYLEQSGSRFSGELMGDPPILAPKDSLLVEVEGYLGLIKDPLLIILGPRCKE